MTRQRSSLKKVFKKVLKTTLHTFTDKAQSFYIVCGFHTTLFRLFHFHNTLPINTHLMSHSLNIIKSAPTNQPPFPFMTATTHNCSSRKAAKTSFPSSVRRGCTVGWSRFMPAPFLPKWNRGTGGARGLSAPTYSKESGFLRKRGFRSNPWFVPFTKERSAHAP